MTAIQIADSFDSFAIDHTPDGWPAVQQKQLTEAAAELRRLEAQLQKETAARQAAQIEAEALKERLVRADAEKCAAVLAERIAPNAPVQEPVQWAKARDVGRYGDMSQHAHMRVGLDSDNDVYVSVWDEQSGATVEFCAPGAGGGKSSKTRMALIALMVAMEEDSAKNPHLDWWARRMDAANGEQLGTSI